MTADEPIPRSSRRIRPPLLLGLCAILWSAPAAAENNRTSSEAIEQTKKEASTRKDEFWWSEKFDPVRHTSNSTTHYFFADPTAALPSPAYIFFPPAPPPLGKDFLPLGPLMPDGPPAPPELAAFVSDFFYPLLGARLAANDLPKELWHRLEAYREARTALQGELRSRIAELNDAGPEMREQQLAALAAAQAPKIAALDATAEKIRLALLPSSALGFLSGTHAIQEAADRRSLLDEHQTAGGTGDIRQNYVWLQHAAFYEEGLGPTQRRLLLEAAHELESRPDSNPPSRQNSAGPQLLTFSPETACVTLPSELSEPLKKSIHEYLALKARLKAELADTIVAHKPGSDAGTQALLQLAANQTQPLAAIESMAEAIRRELAQLPNPPGPPAPPQLPADLAGRISTYRRHKAELLQTLHGMLADVRHPGEQTTIRPSKTASLKESVAEFNRKQTLLIAGLNRELAGIREALADYVRTTGQPGDSKSIDDLLKDFENARQKQEVWDKYRDYQVAVLLPGLSPDQRRLLFDAAVAQLALPLPAGRKLH